MSYDTIKNGLSGIIKSLGFATSVDAVDYTSMAIHNKTFILKAMEGRLKETEQETLADRFYDVQTWQVQIAFNRSEQNDIANRDQLIRKCYDLIKAIDNPANWASYARMQKYFSWEVQELEEYFLLIIKVEITDTITY